MTFEDIFFHRRSPLKTSREAPCHFEKSMPTLLEKYTIFRHRFLPNLTLTQAGIHFGRLNLSFLQIFKFTGHKMLYLIENLTAYKL